MGNRKKVLIVDDSAALVDELTAAFEDAGYEVGAARDGEEVFRRLAALRPDAVLLDVYMPKLNGADVCRMVKAHPHWKTTYLAIMSSRLAAGDAEIFERLGCDAVLRKPFEAETAVGLVGRALVG